MSMEFIVKVEESRPASDGKPSAGPVYRSIYAKDGLMDLPAGLESPWQFFRYKSSPFCFSFMLKRCSIMVLLSVKHTD